MDIQLFISLRRTSYEDMLRVLMHCLELSGSTYPSKTIICLNSVKMYSLEVLPRLMVDLQYS